MTESMLKEPQWYKDSKLKDFDWNIKMKAVHIYAFLLIDYI